MELGYAIAVLVTVVLCAACLSYGLQVLTPPGHGELSRLLRDMCVVYRSGGVIVSRYTFSQAVTIIDGEIVTNEPVASCFGSGFIISVPVKGNVTLAGDIRIRIYRANDTLILEKC